MDLSESVIKSKELPPPQQQLHVVTDFINSQLEGAVPFEDESDDVGSIAEVRETNLRLANGDSVGCKSRNVLHDEESSYLRLGVYQPNSDASLYINGDGTLDLTTFKNGDEIEHFEVPQDEALADPDFMTQIESMYRTITEEVPKPKRVFERFPLPVSIIYIGPEDSQDTLKDPLVQTGFAELPLKGQDAALVDEAHHLYGVFDGVGSLKDSRVAARLAAAVIQKDMGESSAVTPEQARADLAKAVEQAHLAIADLSDTDNIRGGTTATVAKIMEQDEEQYLIYASVGDSRLYVKDNSEPISQITQDEGEGRILHNCLGTITYKGVVQSGIRKLGREWDVILATDGITGDTEDEQLADTEIEQVIDEATTAQDASQRLIDISRKHDDKIAIAVRGRKIDTAAA